MPKYCKGRNIMKFLQRLSVGMLGVLFFLSATACSKNEENNENNAKEVSELFLYDDYSPYITLGDYKNMTLEVESVNVTEQEVTDYINSLLLSKNVIYRVEDERTIENDDIANIDYVGKVDGVEFQGGSASGYNLKIGSGTFIPGFEEGLVGAKKGETRDVKVTFPDPYKSNEELSGKEAVFTVTVNYFGKSVVDINEITDKEVKNGDTVNLDFIGYVDDKELENGDATNFNLVIGSKSLIDGFEDGLIGAKPSKDELVTLNLKFPDTYKNNPDLAGKDVVFKVKVNYIVEYVYPELTDEMANQLSTDYTDVEKYKKSVSDTLLAEEESTYESTLNSQLWTKLTEACPIKEDALPQAEIDYVYNENMNYYQAYADYYSMSLEDFISQYYGKTIDDFKNSLMDNAKTYVGQMILIYAIAKNENIVLTDDEYEEQLNNIYASAGYTSANEMENDLGTVSIQNRFLYNKVMKYLKDKVKIVEPNENNSSTTDDTSDSNK